MRLVENTVLGRIDSHGLIVTIRENGSNVSHIDQVWYYIVGCNARLNPQGARPPDSNIIVSLQALFAARPSGIMRP